MSSSSTVNPDISQMISELLRGKETEAYTSSQLEQWLTNNDPPTETETSQLQQHLDAQLLRLSKLNRVLKALPIPALLDEQSSLQDSVAAYQVVLHPLRKLPTEILQHIFGLCLAESGTPRINLLLQDEVPVVFTRVSRRWRSVALSTHELWGSLSIPVYSGRDVQDIRSRVAKLKLWLSRAHKKPMFVSLCSPQEYEFKHQAEYQLPRAILDHSSYIRVLELRTSDSLLGVMLGGQIRYHRDWPLLEDIAVYATHETLDPSLGDLICNPRNPIWDAPRLKAVEWHSATPDILRLPLKWHQLQVLRISGVVSDPRDGTLHSRTYSNVSIRHMLQSTPNLAALRVSTDDSQERFPEDWFGTRVIKNAETTLRHLTTLTLDETHSSSPLLRPSIFHKLQLPALTHFRYGMTIPVETPVPPTDDHPLICFLRQQHHPVMITNWRVSPSSLSPLGLVEALKLMPHLRHVDVCRGLGDGPFMPEGGGWQVTPGDWMLDALHSLGPASACPRLRTLALDAVEFTADGMRRFAKGRKRLADGEEGMRGLFVPLEQLTVCLRLPYSSALARTLNSGWKHSQHAELEVEMRALGIDADIRFESE